MISVHLVAPRTDLAYADAEVQAIWRSGLKVNPHIGQVTCADFLREIMLVTWCDILWLCTHGAQDGIMLSDGIVTIDTLVQLIRGRFDAVILNTCTSIDVARAIQYDTSVTVIATISDVPDLEAFQTGALLAQALAKYSDIDRAYDTAKNKTYVMLGGSKKKAVT